MSKTLPHVCEYLKPFREAILKRKDKPDMPLTSLPKLNTKMWGIRPNAMTVIGARTSMGKSAFALQIAWDLIQQDIPVLFLSLEMTVIEIVERLFSHAYKIDNGELLRGRLGLYENEYKNFTNKLESKPFCITDCLGKNWREINDYIDNLQDKPKVVIVDYVQMVAQQMTMKGEIDEYIKNFRLMCIRHEFAGIVCSQINRSSQEEGGEPQLHQLKGSGGLEEIADVVILLHWLDKYSEEVEKKNEYKIALAKNRNGITGFIDLKYFPEVYRFSEDPIAIINRSSGEGIDDWQKAN